MADESVTEQMKDLKMDEKKVSDVHEVSWLANVSELKKSSETVIACCCQNL